MRADQKVGCGSKGVVGFERFQFEHVQRCPGGFAFRQGDCQGHGIDQFTARTVHDDGAGPHPGEESSVHNMTCVRGQRGMEAESVRPLSLIFQRDLLNALLAGNVVSQKRIRHEKPKAEGFEAALHAQAYAPQPKKPDHGLFEW